MDKLETKHLELVNKIDSIIDRALDQLDKIGLFEDVTDVDSKGGTKTTRLVNTVGINDLRLLRTSLVQEYNLLNSEVKPDSATDRPSILTLIQTKQITLRDLTNAD